MGSLMVNSKSYPLTYQMLPIVGNAIVGKTAERIVNSWWNIWTNCMDPERNMQLLQDNLHRLSCRASDIKEELKMALSSGKKKRKREVENWFDEVKKIQTEFNQLQTRAEDGFRRHPLSEDPIGKMQYQVRELIEQSHHFNGLVLDDFDNIGEPFSPTKLFGEKSKRDLGRILPCLEIDAISNIGIYGMGGVGKTTLAKHIMFNLSHEKKYRVFWVTVSQEFSIKSLQDKIANVLGLHLSNQDEEEVRASILREAMSKKRKFVLILDDVWDEFFVENVGVSLGANKCRLILTTRSLDVCKRMRCQREFEVKTLDTNASWELFKHTLGGTIPADVEVIAKCVTEECDGLPLGIVTSARSMIGITNVCEWRNALEQLKAFSIGHDEMERDVFRILEWSYSRLNEHQKHCFLYCSLYPEDWHIEREELVNLFIGAELMERRDTRELEFDQGHTILEKLVRVGLLEKTTNREDRECVKMHDLIRDMAIRITRRKSILNIPENVPRFLVKSEGVQQKEWTEDLDAISIWSMKIEIPSDMSPKCSKLSTLLLRDGKIKTIPDSFFRHMSGLKVLNLKRCEYLTELPNCVSNMVNLTALILQDCNNLAHMPPLGALNQLRELKLSHSGIKHIPEGLKELVNLESLEMVETYLQKEIIPKGTFSKLHRLQQLKLPKEVQVCDPEVLNQLDVFQGHLSFTDICEPFIISDWPTYYELLFAGCFPVDYDYNSDSDPYPDAEDKTLVLYGCNFGRGLDVALLPKDIRELEFCECVVEQSYVFQILNSSNDLRYLTIKSSKGVEFLLKLPSCPPQDSMLITIPYGPLQNLKELQLMDLPDFVGFFDWKAAACFRHQMLLPPGTFSSLKDVSISYCHKMRKLFTVHLLQSLKDLVELRVSNCEAMEDIVADEEEEARGSGGGGIPSSSSAPTKTVTLSQLSKLSLRGLPRLKNICKTTIICKSIDYIWVSDCPNVTRFPLFSHTDNGQPSPPNTRWKIYGQKEWWESLQWDIPNAKITLHPFFRALDPQSEDSQSEDF